MGPSFCVQAQFPGVKIVGHYGRAPQIFQVFFFPGFRGVFVSAGLQELKDTNITNSDL